MRNREVTVYLAGALAIAAVGIGVGFCVSVLAGCVCAALALLLVVWSLVFTAWRYARIRKLSALLAVATAKGQVLNLPSNQEGELSILYNDLNKITAALAGQADNLRAEKRLLATALGDISHQLNTPLTSMMLHCDLLLEQDLPKEKQQEFLASILTGLERLRWLVASLLKLSRLDAGVVELKIKPVPLHGLLTAATQPVLGLAEQRQVALQVACERNLVCECDAEWTREALTNLYKNCVEHAPVGGNVWVKCTVNPLHTLVQVEDDGPGFKAEDLPRLFDRFYRGSDSSAEGVGIGLAMARAILRRQGGDITAENRPEGGALFCVKLYR